MSTLQKRHRIGTAPINTHTQHIHFSYRFYFLKLSLSPFLSYFMFCSASCIRHVGFFVCFLVRFDVMAGTIFPYSKYLWMNCKWILTLLSSSLDHEITDWCLIWEKAIERWFFFLVWLCRRKRFHHRIAMYNSHLLIFLFDQFAGVVIAVIWSFLNATKTLDCSIPIASYQKTPRWLLHAIMPPQHVSFFLVYSTKRSHGHILYEIIYSSQNTLAFWLHTLPLHSKQCYENLLLA